jgi:hypothetical protein
LYYLSLQKPRVIKNMSSHYSQKKPPLASSPTPSGKKGFGVAASPFNGIKIELGIAISIGFVLWLAADSITASIATQLLLLVGYGLLSAGWLVYRTRRIVQQIEQQWDEQKNQQTKPELDQSTHSDGR